MALTVAKHIFDKLAGYAGKVALRCDGRAISYSELNAKALRVAAALRESGANCETIGLVGQRTPSSYIGILGILYAGCNYVPINPKYSQQRLLAILRDAKVRFLVGDINSLEVLSPVFSNSDMPPIEGVVIPEGIAPRGKGWRDDASLGNLTPLSSPTDASSDDLAYVMYTSGSTGAPKGVQVTNSNLLAFLHSMASIYRLEPGFHASQTFDFSFDPSVSDLFFTWANGGVLCVLPEMEQLSPQEYIRRERITFWNSVPAIAGFLYKMGHLVPGAFPDLAHSMFCGEQFPKYLADAWRKAAPNSSVENLYGPTEATIYISRHLYQVSEGSREFRNSIIPIGRPFPNHEFALVDEHQNRVPEGGEGEIVFKGPQITRGYLNDREKTDSVFVTFPWDPDGGRWYRSGDLGFYNSDGALECIGRKDSQIKLAGRRIEIGEIEAVLGRYPKTAGAVVIPLRDDNDVVTSCVAFVTTALKKEDEIFIRQDSAKYLERAFFPKRIISIERFPLAPSGKIDRRALAKMA